jgi:hypothetical protein
MKNKAQTLPEFDNRRKAGCLYELTTDLVRSPFTLRTGTTGSFHHR